MSWLSQFLHPEKGYQDAQKELEKYFQQAQQFQQPYLQQGQEAYGQLGGAMNALLNPEELYKRFSSSYEQSPETTAIQNMATEQGLNAASSLGLMGSSPALQAIQGGTSQIGLDARRQYLDDLMQKYLSGVGIAQGIYGTGANAAGQLGQNAMNMGQNAAQLKYGESSAQGNLFGNLLGTGAGFIGGALSAPLGAKFGQMIGAPQTPQFNPYGGGYSPGSGMPMYR